MAFSDAFDMACTAKYDLQSIYMQARTLTMMTTILSFFNHCTKSSVTIEKRIMIDLQTIEDSYQN